jgi:hypothetical protein
MAAQTLEILIGLDVRLRRQVLVLVTVLEGEIG